MKNIQIIDGAENCTFSFFQSTEEEFKLIFPENNQDIQYFEDIKKANNMKEIQLALSKIWKRPIRKKDVNGVHGTLFYEMDGRKKYYTDKREDCIIPSAINEAQRRLFYKDAN